MTTMTCEKTDLDSTIKKIIIEKLGVDESLLIDTAHFKDDLGIDSLDMLELQTELEEEFHITIPDEEAEKLTTVSSIINYIKYKH